VTADEIAELRAREFPITSSWSYLNHAGRGPLPMRHVNAAESSLSDQANLPYVEGYDITVAKLNEVRMKLSALMRCASSDVAILGNTAQGINLVAQGRKWRTGDEVVTYQYEFPNLVLPWVNLRAQGVGIVFVPDRGHKFVLEDVVAAIGPRTRAVALSLVNFAHGYRAPIEEIGDLCSKREIWLVVDVIHALGALDVDATALKADILSAHAYKYLLGGFGVSACYCSVRARQVLRIPSPGWFSREATTDTTRLFDFFDPFSSDARRFESSTPSLSGLHGFSASLDLLLEYESQERSRRVLDLNDYLVQGLQSRGWQVVSSTVPAERSGIVAAAMPGIDGIQLKQALSEARVAVSVRDSHFLRVSPHFYNTQADCDQLFDCLDGFTRTSPSTRHV
jgi:cysteine desulfurase/selenocysteine lyase